ncbi:hypothetical protein FQN50_007775 [Emmonsiellopsis sp. PD_5]|nr:hypothetical protein FQN50_007775 [Emmonsiellopsis sp. PD_5]
MSIYDLPVELIPHVFPFLWDPHWITCKEQRDLLFTLRLVNRSLSSVATSLAFSVLDIVTNVELLTNLRVPEGLALLIREKKQSQACTGSFFTLLSTLRETATVFLSRSNGNLLEGTSLSTEGYLNSFITACIGYLGRRATIEHILAQNMPKEVAFFGANLGDYDILLLAAAADGDQGLVLSLLESDAISGDSQVFNIALYMSAYMGHVAVLDLIMERRSPEVDAGCGKFGNALQAAAAKGNLDVIRSLLRWGADINAPGRKFSSPLHRAISGLHPEAVKLLLDLGADSTVQDYKNDDLFRAVVIASHEMENAERAIILEYLLEKQRPPKAAHLLNSTARLGHHDLMAVLLRNGVDPNSWRSCKGMEPPLVSAVLGGRPNLRVLELLIDNGADVNAASVFYTGGPLELAAQHGHIQSVSFLLGHMMNSSEINSEKYKKAMLRATQQHHTDVLRILLDRCAEVTDIEPESIISQFQALHKHGPDPPFMDLLDAIECNDESMVKGFLAEGVDVHADRLRRGTPIKVALTKGNSSIVRLLLDSGVHLDSKQLDSALRSAIKKKHTDIVRLLLDRLPADYIIDLTRYEHEFEQELSLHILFTVIRLAEVSKRKSEARKILGNMGPEVLEIAELLQKKGVASRAIFFEDLNTHVQMAEFPNVEPLEFILDCQPDIRLEPLSQDAATRCNISLLELILARYPKDKSNKEAWMKAALLRAVRFGEYTTVEWLLSHGAIPGPLLPLALDGTYRVESNLWMGKTQSILYRGMLRSETMLRLLIAHGAFPAAPSHDLMVDIMLVATRAGSVLVLKLLLDRGMDILNTPIPEIRGYSYPNALSLSISEDQIRVTRFLLEAGATHPCDNFNAAKYRYPKKPWSWWDTSKHLITSFWPTVFRPQ